MRSDTSWLSLIDLATHVFASLRPTESAWLSRAWSDWCATVHIVKPETVVSWHRRGFRLFWTWKSRQRIGRLIVPHDVRTLIREMSTANPL